MFTRQKKNYRTVIYAALVVTLCLLVVALLWPKENPADKDDISANAQTETPVQEKPPQTQEEPQKPSITNQNQTYYLVRKDGEQISVYFMDESGKQVKLENTDILYEFLPPDDQKSFDQGIKVATQEELAALLQDFES